MLSLLMTSNNLALWRLHRDKVLGVLFALTGNSFTSLSLCIQKKVHLEKSPKAKHFLFSLYWWQVLNIICLEWILRFPISFMYDSG